MLKKESVRRYILFGILVIVFVGLLTAKVLGNKQNEEFILNDQLYNQTLQLYGQGNYEEAMKVSSQLLKRVPNSETVNFLGGLIASSNNEFHQAAILLQKTLDLNPHKVHDAIFMLKFGEALLYADRKEDAIIVLEYCRDMGWAPEDFPEYQQQVAELLNQISAVQ